MVNFKDLLPKQPLDALAMGFTFVMIPATYLYGVLYVIPTLWPISDVPEEMAQQNHFSHYLHSLFCTLLFFQTYSSLIMTTATDTSCGRIALPVVSQPGWFFCPHCQHYSPPRAHHCSTCKRCVLRRDHHCFFVGKCIGYYNHRYFISFLLYLVITSIYGAVISFLALVRLLGGFTLSMIPGLIFPMLGWLFQIIPVNPLIMMETSVLGFVVLGAGVLLGIQVYEMYYGQTYYEMKKNDSIYGRALFRNIADIMGKNWLLGLLIPCLPSERIGDGSHYKPRDVTMPTTTAANQNAGPKPGTRKMVQST